MSLIDSRKLLLAARGAAALEADREVANTLADLILGGLLVTDDLIDQGDDLGA